MTTPDKQHERADALAGPMSPELVLVDPELARVARDQLNIRDSQAPPAATAAARTEANGSEPAPTATPRPPFLVRAALDLEDMRARASEAAAIEPPPRRARKRKHRVVALIGAACMLAVGVGGIAVKSARDADRALAELDPTREPAVTTADDTPTTGTGSRARTVPPVDPPPAPPQPPAVEAPPPPPPPRPSSFATRTFVWPSVSGATFYRVEFFRRRSKVFQASPTRTRIELPLRWSYQGRRFRLTPGTYRWVVRPAFGPRSRPRYGRPVTQSTWIAK